MSTSGGAAGQGQVWEYSPAKNRLRLVFESPGAGSLNAPDNITVSPRGGLVLCEDGGGCYSPDGKWLFANIQSPGITFAITGPWQNGAL